MDLLRKEELWRYMLRREPTKRHRHRRYLWEGFCYWLAMCIMHPRKAAGCIGGVLLIALMMGVLIFTAGVM